MEKNMNEIRLKAHAKINISLDIVGKRGNGYHDVEMIMQTIGLYDDLTLRKQVEDKITIRTNLTYLPTDQRNLVYQIIEYMKREFSISSGVFVDLFKRIPVAAGLAGGSSNGAQAIIGMNQLFGLNLTTDTMLEIGQKFGSDIPYCIIQGTALATGLGETLTLLDPFPECSVVLLKPKFGVSTATVYKNYHINEEKEHPNTKELLSAIANNNLDYICSNLVNVLESVTCKLHPELKQIKQQLSEQGADGVLMSGSGPSVFGLFKDKQMATQAYDFFKQTKQLQYVYLTSIYNIKRG
jgi:4-diphosphocytidyl-2-C-methyl-D-erythritol kinase